MIPSTYGDYQPAQMNQPFGEFLEVREPEPCGELVPPKKVRPSAIDGLVDPRGLIHFEEDSHAWFDWIRRLELAGWRIDVVSCRTDAINRLDDYHYDMVQSVDDLVIEIAEETQCQATILRKGEFDKQQMIMRQSLQRLTRRLPRTNSNDFLHEGGKDLWG